MSNEEPIEVIGNPGEFDLSFKKLSEEDGLTIYSLEMKSDRPATLNPINLKWSIPAHNVKGVWSTNALHEKRLRADWEAPSVEARLSVDAPVICLFGHEDENVVTFACSDVIGTTVLEAPVREEDSLIYCQIKLFTERLPMTDHYQTQIRIDRRSINFGKAIEAVGDWWARFEQLKPAPTPDMARMPLYSTWYAYHQVMTEDQLLEECKIAKGLGCELIIVDDGWQTMDSNRGYDYTGDWEPDRFQKMVAFVEAVHQLEMKVMIWFSVPFCGVKSKAYQQFKGKFLTENHRWAPVFDPRYPEVRAYLVNIYVNALKTWKVDGFKLDFIDDFKVYPETDLSKADGRDYASVNRAVECLLREVYESLYAIQPDILIEFRQKYIGPALRCFGNMFRAFDCPNDSLTNRIRTTDVKLLCGRTAVHSDMFTWHYDEPVELAALQVVNILFSVPQISVRLGEVSKEYLQMLHFYSHYWRNHREILLDGEFQAYRPSSNYPLLKSKNAKKIIYGVYDETIVELDANCSQQDLINGKRSGKIVIQVGRSLGKCQVKVYNCCGQEQSDQWIDLNAGLHALDVPAAGLCQIQLPDQLT